jgi:hypothetical protein
MKLHEMENYDPERMLFIVICGSQVLECDIVAQQTLS